MYDSDIQGFTLSFGEAVQNLKEYVRVTREDWHDKGIYVGTDNNPAIKMTLPFIFMRTEKGHFVPWLPSQSDIFAEDWGIVVPFVPGMGEGATATNRHQVCR